MIYQPDEIKGKKNLTKFINYTTKSPVYYGCPDKFPHLSFRVGIHPKNYCLPCCDLGASTKTSKKHRANLLCLKDQTVDISKLSDIKVKIPVHIFKYGKSIDAGRMSHVPKVVNELLSAYSSKIYIIGICYL